MNEEVARFSVLLPVYAGDDPEHFALSVRSVTVEQDLRPAELVIVRDGPVSDALEEALRAARDLGVPLIRVDLPRNLGLARALEAGLAACTHGFVARQDADDVSAPGRFSAQIPMLEAGYDIVGSAIAEFTEAPGTGEADGASSAEIVRRQPASQADIYRTARFASPFNHPSVAYRASAVKDAGGYQDLPLMEDYWLFARMIARGARVANLPEPLVHYRIGAGAYARRGGWRLLRSEFVLQRRFRGIGFTTAPEMVRNLAVRGGYRLVPEGLRKRGYRLWRRLRRGPSANE